MVNVIFLKKFFNSFCRKVLSIEISKFRPDRQAVIEAKKLFGEREIVACEIGVFEGDHALQILKNLNVKKLYLIDPYEKYEEYSSDMSYKKVIDAKKKAHKLLGRHSDKIVWIEKYSDDAVKDIPEKLDFLYLDGNHFTPYIDNDIKNYFPLVKLGGIFSGHDYVEFYRDVIDAVNKFGNSIGKKVVFGYGTDWIIFK